MAIKKETLFTLFRPLSSIYGGVMKTREKMYQNDHFKSSSFDVPVISVGNLTMGGTGKTPLVIYLANYFLKKQFRPAIISRGYRGTAEKPVNLVSDYQSIYLSGKEAGDEPRLMAEKLPGVPVLTGKKRKDPCQYAVDKLGCNLLLLDDGFQHLGVKRDIDLVLFNANEINNPKNIFPGGELREPYSALKRCDCILYTGATESSMEDIEKFDNKLKTQAINKPSFITSLGGPVFFDFYKRKIEPHTFATDGSLAFCGIGNPSRFKEYLLDNQINIQLFRSFDDHHTYTQEDIEELEYYAKQNGAVSLITTEKDMVKLQNITFNFPVFTVIPKITVPDIFNEFLDKMIAAFFEENEIPSA